MKILQHVVTFAVFVPLANNFESATLLQILSVNFRLTRVLFAVTGMCAYFFNSFSYLLRFLPGTCQNYLEIKFST